MAAKVLLTIDQGSYFETTVTLKEDGVGLDLTKYTGAGQIRRSYESNTAYDFDIGLSNNGVVTISLDANTSNNMEYGRYTYDVELTDNITGKTSRIIEGYVTIKPGVTR